MSPCRAASINSAPSGARHSLPSIVSWMIFSSGRGMSVDRDGTSVLVGHPQSDDILQRSYAGAFAARLDLRLELAPELLDHRSDRHRHRVAEDAQAIADDLLLDRGHDVEVHRRRLA